jgi:hypothetical protein
VLILSSFRYEVKVTTPHFLIEPMSGDECRESFLLDDTEPIPGFPWSLFRRNSRYLSPPHFRAALLGSPDSRLGTFSPDTIKNFVTVVAAGSLGVMKIKNRFGTEDGPGEDVPNWVNLLDDIHCCQQYAVKMAWKDDLAPICITSMFSRFRMLMTYRLIRT